MRRAGGGRGGGGDDAQKRSGCGLMTETAVAVAAADENIQMRVVCVESIGKVDYGEAICKCSCDDGRVNSAHEHVELGCCAVGARKLRHGSVNSVVLLVHL